MSEKKFMLGSRPVKDEAAVEYCRKLYFKYGGTNHSQIEREMREAGFTKFNRRNIQTTFRRDGRIARRGWAQRFGWERRIARRARGAETARARRARTFESWLKTHGDGMKWTEPFQELICRTMKRITDGEVRRLMLFMPPRHGKSELVTVRYAAWRLTRYPRLNIIIGSYNQQLANRFSRKIRKIAARGLMISNSRHAAEEWETAVGGSVKAVGVGAGITGFGGDLIIIDDPVKGRAVANSKTFREKMWDWYRDDISTRLEPKAPIILIQTRWHEDDLAGRLLKEMSEGGEQWEVIRLPALAEAGESPNVERPRPIESGRSSDSPPYEGGVAAASADGVVLHEDEIPQSALPTPQSPDPLGRTEGEALWPSRFDREELLAIRRRLGTRSFDALYQQRPHPEGGTIFRAEWFTQTVAKHPDGLRWFRGYDLAASVRTSADFTASFRVAFDKRDGKIYIADGFRKRIEFPDQRRYVLDRMAEEPDTVHCIEEAMHGKALVQDLRRDARSIGRALRGVRPVGDKLMRAEAWAPYAEEGRVVLVSGPWIAEFIDEVCRFTGKGDAHDDQVDAVSIAVQAMNAPKGFQAY